MTLAVVRSLDWPRQPRSETELDDFEQELVDQYALAAEGSGVGDNSIAGDRPVVIWLEKRSRRFPAMTNLLRFVSPD